MRNPPILVAVIGFFAALAGFSFLFFGLRAIGFDWFGAFGDLPAFNNVGLWGWLAVVTGIIWLLAALGLWALQPWARLFAMFMCGLALLEAAIAFFQFPGAGIALGMALMPAVSSGTSARARSRSRSVSRTSALRTRPLRPRKRSPRALRRRQVRGSRLPRSPLEPSPPPARAMNVRLPLWRRPRLP